MQNHKRTTPRVFAHAQELRQNQTPAELRLWACLKGHRGDSMRFRRQHAIGKYVADFCCPRKKLIIELDGSQHLEQEQYDSERTAFFEAQGFRGLRFWNDEVMKDVDAVMQVILEAME